MLSHSWRIATALTAAAASLSLITACASSGSTTAAGSMPTPATTPGTSAAQFPVTVHAANGSVTIPVRPTAIVSLSPTATEMLYAIGAGSQVKAVDKYSNYPKGTPLTSLDGDHVNIEAIASYQPDLVVASQVSAGMGKQLGALGIPVLSEPAAANLDQAYQEIVQLGQATGHTTAAHAEVTKITGQVAAIVKSMPKPASPVTYYYELDQTYYSETSATFIGQVLGMLGLTSIADSARGAASSGGYPQLSAEFILKTNPDYIFLADTICCQQSPATVAARPGWSTLRAVQDGRVIALNDDIASRWGPRIVNLLQTVTQALRRHPVRAGS